jgi:hypothetical protein
MTAPFSHLPADGADEGVDIFKLSIFRVPFHFTASWHLLQTASYSSCLVHRHPPKEMAQT